MKGWQRLWYSGRALASKSGGREFESDWVLVFFSSLSFSVTKWCVVNQVPREGATTLIFQKNWMLSGGKKSLISTELAKKGDDERRPLVAGFGKQRAAIISKSRSLVGRVC